jgi:hypothetical protein
MRLKLKNKTTGDTRLITPYRFEMQTNNYNHKADILFYLPDNHVVITSFDDSVNVGDVYETVEFALFERGKYQLECKSFTIL